MPVDQRHGRAIPLGRPLARVLRIAFRQIGNSVAHSIWQGDPLPNLRQWQAWIVEHSEPLLFGTAVRSARRMLTTIRRAERMPRRRRKALVGALLKDNTHPPAFPAPIVPFGQPPPMVQFSWDVFLRQVAEQVRIQAIEFARSTLDTSIHDAMTAYAETRRELEEGLSRGDALAHLGQRMRTVFDSPDRAFTIAATESSRAMHRGEQIAQEESQVVYGNEWLASSDACPLCLKLDGQERKLGEPFAITPNAPAAYRVCLHPPKHPRCQCSMAPVLK